MQQLAGDTVRNDGAFIRELFLQRLPSNVRMVLASASTATAISELAKLADRIMEVATPSLPTAANPSISTVSPSLQSFDQEKLHAEITSLKEEIKSLRRPTRERSPRRRSPSPAADISSDMCWYHQKFGSSAQKCRPPCSFSGNTSAGR